MRPTVRMAIAAAGVAAALLPIAVNAHFILVEPASWLVENQLGDPQKMGPCGGTSADPGKPSEAISKIIGGQKLHIKVQETIYHPGHYRVALAVNSRAELPPDPVVTTRDTDRGPRSVSAKIQDPVAPPVIVDGLFPHTEKPAQPWETDIQLPNITCLKCTLQVIQFMAEHGLNKDGDYTYHHCAELQITADPSKPLDKGWPAVK